MKANPFLKRTIDLLGGVIGLGLFCPLIAVIGLLIRLDSHGPVFHRAKRVGQHGNLFIIYKFRTMVKNADKLGPGITSAGDSRITRVGRFLRRTKLDELPQFINVIRGDMSLVGPRPEDPRFVELYSARQRRVLAVRPGMTSLASVRYRHEADMLRGEAWEQHYIEVILPAKLEIDLHYVENPSLWQDMLILAKTFTSLIR